MPREAAFSAGCEPVAQTHVGKRPAHHHFVVAAPRTVRIEVLGIDATLDEIPSGRRRFRYAAGGRDVVGRHAVADEGEYASARDVLERLRLARHAVEEWRFLDVRRCRVPGKSVAAWDRERAPT